MIKIITSKPRITKTTPLATKPVGKFLELGSDFGFSSLF